MIFESILLTFLIATLIIGIRLYFDLRQLKTYKDDYERFLDKAESQLSDIEKITERFRFISSSKKESLQHLTTKAKSLKDDLLYITERSENVFQKLSSAPQSIRVDEPLDRKKVEKTSEDASNLALRKNKLMNAIKDLR
jgi:Fic family protein